MAVAPVWDKYSTYPSNGLTPVRLAQIFREAERATCLRQMELFEEMEEKDPHLFFTAPDTQERGHRTGLRSHPVFG
uniref:DUF935 domain-containing protein n=1 Tax=Paenibacillus melissococcoides TaxID=2912268 RepID=UPI0021C33AE4|nr:DUF935 domain-containing protein [Paenibacillus melissococcoides]